MSRNRGPTYRTTRRAFVGAMCSAPLLCSPRQRPNVLVFMTDQESAWMPGPVRRPNYDLVASRGIRFTSAFCNTPQCSPARSSLLTGLEPHHSGVLTNVDPSSLGTPLSPEHTTLGSVFKSSQYKTGYFGKWHLGGESASLKQFGFDEYASGKTDEDAAGSAAKWIKSQAGPWLAWVSVLNPHDIYNFSRDESTSLRPGVRAPLTSRADLSGKPPAQLE